VDTVVLDKTGTITAGKPTVVGLHPAAGVTEERLLAMAAAAERSSEHPLGEAIVRAASERGVVLPAVADFRSTAGGGVEVRVDGQAVRVGTPEFAYAGAVPVDVTQLLAAEREQARTAVVATLGGAPLGVISIADALLPDARDAVAALRAMGISVAMASGDAQRVAERIAAEVGIDRVHAGMLPGDKAKVVGELRAQGRQVVMVGDGVNDAPALASANVGIAVGGGADIAADAAELVLMQPGVMRVADAVHVARATMRTVRQNLWWAFGYNIIGIPLAAGILWPWFHWNPGPIVAAVSMSFSSVAVVTNSLRLRSAARR
jgi:Cu+-exporting ATPase